jgi:hypothetical protein
MKTHKLDQNKLIKSILTLHKRHMIRNTCFFAILITMFGCSSFHFDNDMPLKTASLKEFNSELIGNYYLNDSILKIEDDIYYNNRRNINPLMNKDSFNLISVNLTISKFNLSYIGEVKKHYKIGKVDTAIIIRKHKEEKKTTENGFLIITENFDDTLLTLEAKDKLKMYGNKFI